MYRWCISAIQITALNVFAEVVIPLGFELVDWLVFFGVFFVDVCKDVEI